MHIEQVMTIYTAAELKPRLLRELQESAAPEFDLSGVEEMDGAGLQLLLLARREAAAAARPLRILNASAAVSDVLDLAGLQADCEMTGEAVCRGLAANDRGAA